MVQLLPWWRPSSSGRRGRDADLCKSISLIPIMSIGFNHLLRRALLRTSSHAPPRRPAFALTTALLSSIFVDAVLGLTHRATEDCGNIDHEQRRQQDDASGEHQLLRLRPQPIVRPRPSRFPPQAHRVRSCRYADLCRGPIAAQERSDCLYRAKPALQDHHDQAVGVPDNVFVAVAKTAPVAAWIDPHHDLGNRVDQNIVHIRVSKNGGPRRRDRIGGCDRWPTTCLRGTRHQRVRSMAGRPLPARSRAQAKSCRTRDPTATPEPQRNATRLHP